MMLSISSISNHRVQKTTTSKQSYKKKLKIEFLLIFFSLNQPTRKLVKWTELMCILFSVNYWFFYGKGCKIKVGELVVKESNISQMLKKIFRVNLKSMETRNFKAEVLIQRWALQNLPNGDSTPINHFFK